MAARTRALTDETRSSRKKKKKRRNQHVVPSYKLITERLKLVLVLLQAFGRRRGERVEIHLKGDKGGKTKG